MKLVIIEPLGVEKEKLLAIAGEYVSDRVEIIYYDTKVTDTATLIERGKDADIIVVSNLPMNGEVIRGCDKLKLLSVAFTGVDHIDLSACREKGVTVCNCAGYSTAAVADLVFGMVITGAIGMRTAKIARAFGCQVFAFSRTEKELPGVVYLPLEKLLASCDIISLHVPLTEETRGLIGKEELALMKKSAILINTARGPVVDSTALANALQTGQIAGAAVDVFETEPPVASDHPLLQVKNLIATPHVAFATKEAMVKRAHTVFGNVKAWEAGTPQNVI